MNRWESYGRRIRGSVARNLPSASAEGMIVGGIAQLKEDNLDSKGARLKVTTTFEVEDIGDWGHPRGQQMMAFKRI